VAGAEEETAEDSPVPTCCEVKRIGVGLTVTHICQLRQILQP
jgi:hypothetical protein